MHRFAIVCCAAVLLSSTAAFAFDPDQKMAAGRLLLANRGLTQFDLDGNGTLDAGERTAALAARNAARNAPSVLMNTAGPVGYANSQPVSFNQARMGGYPNSQPVSYNPVHWGGYPSFNTSGNSYPSPVLLQSFNAFNYPYPVPSSYQTSQAGIYQWSPAPNVHVLFGGVNPGNVGYSYTYPSFSGNGMTVTAHGTSTHNGR